MLAWKKPCLQPVIIYFIINNVMKVLSSFPTGAKPVAATIRGRAGQRRRPQSPHTPHLAADTWTIEKLN